MSFKKYVFSMIICAVTIFVMIGSAFVPIKSFADGWAVDWFGTELWRDKKNNLQSEDVYYLQVYYDRTYSLRGFSISPSKVEKVSINDYYDKITLTFNNIPDNGYYINSYIFSNGTIIYSGRAFMSRTVLEYTCSKDMSYSSEKVEEDDISLLDNFLYTVLGIKEVLSYTIDEVSNSPVGEFFSKLGSVFKNYVKTTLGITDDDTLNTVITEISEDNYLSDFWNNIPEKTKKNVQHTYSNLKNFVYNNVDVTQDEDGKYHYTVKTYNPVTNTYPDYFYSDASTYFNTNIVAHDDSTTDDTNNWLQKIYNAIIDLPNNIKSNVTTNVTNTYNYLFTPSDDFWNEWDLKFSNTLNDKFPVIKQVEDFTKNVGDIINSYSEEDFAVGSVNDFFAFDNNTELEVQTLSLEDDISNIETSYTGYIPKISIDLSKIKLMGYPLGDGKVIVMDFTWYLKYRPLIFTLIIVISYTWYIISLFKSLPRLIGNVADVLDYRQDVEVANSINEYNESVYYFSELAKNLKE